MTNLMSNSNKTQIHIYTNTQFGQMNVHLALFFRCPIKTNGVTIIIPKAH